MSQLRRLNKKTCPDAPGAGPHNDSEARLAICVMLTLDTPRRTHHSLSLFHNYTQAWSAWLGLDELLRRPGPTSQAPQLNPNGQRLSFSPIYET